MNKTTSILAISLLLAACSNDPASPFYNAMTPTTPAVVNVDTPVITTDESVAQELIEKVEDVVEGTEVVQVASAGGQCLASDVLANVTYSVVAKGTKGTVEKSGGKEYFVASGTRHDVTNVPYSLTSC